MGKRKINLRKVSESFESLVRPIDNKDLRVSAGRENQIGEFYYLKTSCLFPYPHQARKSFDASKIDELGKTILLHGIRQPLTVEKIANEVGKYYVVSGERRLQAAISVNLDKVPCIILNSGDSSEEIALIENIQRTDLHPLELASAYQKLLSERKQGDQKKLADRIGVAPTTISEHLKYNMLPNDVKSVLLKQNIHSRSILRRLLKCTNEQSMMKMLGVHKTFTENEMKKTLFQVYLKNGELHIGKMKDNIPAEEKAKLIESLKNYIKLLKNSL